MQNLQDKNILLGITGGIAAYKTPELVRRLKDKGANVRCVLTESAKAFVSPLSLQAVSGQAISDSLLDRDAELAMGHIELAKWADLILIAPATANVIAKIANGIADDLLSTLCLATAAPIALAPAMNQQMWCAQATTDNVSVLRKRQYKILGPDSGDQACGDVGPGRMLDVPELVEACEAHFISNTQLANQNWVITAGPTREAIDPVRYISNHSSGKMGYAIAQAAKNLGASVTLISGPVNIQAPLGVDVVSVASAEQMHKASLELASQADVFIACAAVADYRVDAVADQKIKKSADSMQINLVKNPDIVADVAALTKQRPFTVGFAAETQDVEQYAMGKLKRKKLDLIAANDVAQQGQGFNSDDNALIVFSASDSIEIPLASKHQVAQSLVDIISEKVKR